MNKFISPGVFTREETGHHSNGNFLINGKSEEKFDFDDILIQPEVITEIDTRSLISVYYDNLLVPITEGFKRYVSEVSDFGKTGALLLIFLIITFVSITLTSPVITLILLPLPITLGSFIGIIELEWPWLLGLHFVFIALAMAMSNRG